MSTTTTTTTTTQTGRFLMLTFLWFLVGGCAKTSSPSNGTPQLRQQHEAVGP